MEPIKGPGDWIAVVILAALLVAGVVAVVVLMIRSDTRVDEVLCPPNDPCRRSAYRVLNDTDRTVKVDECFDHCADPERRSGPLIRPDETISTDDLQVGARIKEHTWFLVTDASGGTLGCLVLDGYKHKHDGDLVAISAARACSDSGPLTPLLSRAR